MSTVYNLILCQITHYLTEHFSGTPCQSVKKLLMRRKGRKGDEEEEEENPFLDLLSQGKGLRKGKFLSLSIHL